MKRLDLDEIVKHYMEELITWNIPPALPGDDPASLALIAVQRAMNQFDLADALMREAARNLVDAWPDKAEAERRLRR